jgi:hypothetical protein
LEKHGIDTGDLDDEEVLTRGGFLPLSQTEVR